MGEADPLTLSTVLECFGTSHDEAVGEAVVAVLRKSPAALTTLGEDRLKRLLAGYPEKVRRDSEPLFQQLRDAQRERIDKLRKLEPLLTAGGDVGRGRRIFFGQKVACSSCHTIGAEGRPCGSGPDGRGRDPLRSRSAGSRRFSERELRAGLRDLSSWTSETIGFRAWFVPNRATRWFW